MEKGLFYLIECEGEFAGEIGTLVDLGSFFNTESARIIELSGILRSLGRRADFEFAEQAYGELEREKKNARRLLLSVDASHQKMLGNHLEETAARLEKISGEILRLKSDAEKIREKEGEKYALNIKRANLATAHLKASEELAFLNELKNSIGKNFSELEKILGQLSPLIKQAYLPSLPNNLEKTLSKQKALLEKIREGRSPEKNTGVFYERLQEILMDLKALNEKFLPFLERTAEALELLERALGEWASLHSLLLKYSRDMDAINKGTAQVLEGAGFNSIPQIERKLPDVEPPQLPIPPKQALFLRNRVLEVNSSLSAAQWRVFAAAQAPKNIGTRQTTENREKQAEYAKPA